MTHTQFVTLRTLARYGLIEPTPLELREMARWSDEEDDAPTMRGAAIIIIFIALGAWAVALAWFWVPWLWKVM